MSQSSIFTLQKNFPMRNLFMLVRALEPIWRKLAKKCAQDWSFLLPKHTFCQNYRRRLFNQSFSRCFLVCDLLLKCPIVCLILRNESLMWGKCQEVHIFISRLHKQIRFLSKEPLQFLLSWSQSTNLFL